MTREPKVSRALLRWYDRHRRDLPWRRTQDPYEVLVSEVMLQQTRVETVARRYQEFLGRFPTLEALARADIEDVLATWSGLGYYRRARMLHKAAQAILDGDGFPETASELRTLPGVGEYTAAAVASIAFGEAVPALDGNVERVLSRHQALDGDVRRRAARNVLLETAGGLLDPSRPGDSNQALMELGATVCTPRRPECPCCPLSTSCRAAASGRPEAYPRRRRRRPAVRQRRLLAVVEEKRRILLIRRADDCAVLAGAWELPWIDLDRVVGDDAHAAEELLAQRYGGHWYLLGPRARARHTITHRVLVLLVQRAAIESCASVAESHDSGWFAAAQRRRIPRSAMVDKALLALSTLSGSSP